MAPAAAEASAASHHLMHWTQCTALHRTQSTQCTASHHRVHCPDAEDQRIADQPAVPSRAWSRGLGLEPGALGLGLGSLGLRLGPNLGPGAWGLGPGLEALRLGPWGLGLVTGPREPGGPAGA